MLEEIELIKRKSVISLPKHSEFMNYNGPFVYFNRSLLVCYKDDLLVACGCFHHVEDFLCAVSEVISVDHGVIKASHGWQYDTGKGKDQTYQVIVKWRHLAN